MNDAASRRHLLRLRHTIGELSCEDLVLASLFCLWAGAVDRVAGDRDFSCGDVGDWCALPGPRCRWSLEALRRRRLVDERDERFRLTGDGVAALEWIVDVTQVLAAAP